MRVVPAGSVAANETAAFELLERMTVVRVSVFAAEYVPTPTSHSAPPEMT